MVFTVKLQCQPIQVEAWEAYKQVGSILLKNEFPNEKKDQPHLLNVPQLCKKKITTN